MKHKKATSQQAITLDEFHKLVQPVIGLKVSRVWRGYGSTIFLELGPLHDEVHTGSNGAKRVSQRGQHTIMIEWGWRVERPKSIAFGCWSTDRIINNRLSQLEGLTISGIEPQGRLPELVVQLSDSFWLHSFNISDGQPEWIVFLDRQRHPREWLMSQRGKLIKETSLVD